MFYRPKSPSNSPSNVQATDTIAKDAIINLSTDPSANIGPAGIPVTSKRSGTKNSSSTIILENIKEEEAFTSETENNSVDVEAIMENDTIAEALETKSDESFDSLGEVDLDEYQGNILIPVTSKRSGTKNSSSTIILENIKEEEAFTSETENNSLDVEAIMENDTIAEALETKSDESFDSLGEVDLDEYQGNILNDISFDLRYILSTLNDSVANESDVEKSNNREDNIRKSISFCP